VSAEDFVVGFGVVDDLGSGFTLVDVDGGLTDVDGGLVDVDGGLTDVEG